MKNVLNTLMAIKKDGHVGKPSEKLVYVQYLCTCILAAAPKSMVMVTDCTVAQKLTDHMERAIEDRKGNSAKTYLSLTVIFSQASFLS